MTTMADNKTREIFLQGGVANDKRVSIGSEIISGLIIPVTPTPRSGAFGQETYRPTGQTTADGLEIWNVQTGIGH